VYFSGIQCILRMALRGSAGFSVTRPWKWHTLRVFESTGGLR
jgi:hypothetical protein